MRLPTNWMLTVNTANMNLKTPLCRCFLSKAVKRRLNRGAGHQCCLIVSMGALIPPDKFAGPGRGALQSLSLELAGWSQSPMDGLPRHGRHGDQGLIDLGIDALLSESLSSALFFCPTTPLKVCGPVLGRKERCICHW